jgi:hypothetical protein
MTEFNFKFFLQKIGSFIITVKSLIRMTISIFIVPSVLHFSVKTFFL